MRKPDKSQLKAELLKGVTLSLSPEPPTAYVVDGGNLLHAVKWLKTGTNVDVALQYLSYLTRNYAGSVTVVFDGYCNGPSIKDHEHQRRSSKCSPDVAFKPSMVVYENQTMFLSNERNKQAFVNFLASLVKDSGYTVFEAPDDADTLIAKTAIDFARAKNTRSVTVIANDTDILVLLVYHFNTEMAEIFMMSRVFSKASWKTELISIRQLRLSLGLTAANSLLAIHAISGCDTTSTLFEHGKRSVWKKLSKSVEASKYFVTLSNNDATHEQAVQAGANLIRIIYEGAESDTLNKLRYQTYMNLTATSTHLLRPERLPPTNNAAHFHCLRAHLQTVIWQSLSTNTLLNPTDWGWQIHEGRLVPIATDIDAAPEDLLKVVRCKCRSDTRSPSSCSCRKVGLPCVASCKNCAGVECENPSPSMSVEDCETDELNDELSVDNRPPFGETNNKGMEPHFYEEYLFRCVDEETVNTSGYFCQVFSV
jgi:hypothetical protein